MRRVVVPEAWRPFYEETHIPAAVWVGDTLRVTGHTGEDADGVHPSDVDAQIRGTFRNVGITLAEAGVGWSDVVELTTYHVDLRVQAHLLLGAADEYLDDPYPAFTTVGVVALFPPEAVVEISCVAVVSAARTGQVS